jgi:hypothetical protein
MRAVAQHVGMDSLSGRRRTKARYSSSSSMSSREALHPSSVLLVKGYPAPTHWSGHESVARRAAGFWATRSRDRRRPRSQKLQRAIDFRLMFALESRCAQMTTMLDLYSTFIRTWLQPMRPLSSALVLSGTGYRAPSLCNPVAQRRSWRGATARRRRFLQEGRAQVHAALGRQTEGQGQRL